eukprot:TRINITY_DN2564_c0_g1_i1.p2 TRINITY_DN2564_c0_g1~~TRINITY_DN2564_c0_g1_i1.p2  ORF type:complete len:129 (+),score=4.83 TRINITY_DN2564_c0_g1_i1:286-672(+)
MATSRHAVVHDPVAVAVETRVAMEARRPSAPPMPSVAQRSRSRPSPRVAAHRCAAGGAADTAHGRAGAIECRATGRLHWCLQLASKPADLSPSPTASRGHNSPLSPVVYQGEHPPPPWARPRWRRPEV